MPEQLTFRHTFRQCSTVNEAMTTGGTTLQAQSRAIDAKEILMKRKITAAPVVDENGKLTGAINLQDFYQAGII